jgi:hypothetical protein
LSSRIGRNPANAVWSGLSVCPLRGPRIRSVRGPISDVK